MQTTYNAFSGSAPASNDNAFQSAIDYLIANRQKPVFNNGGLFAQGSQTNTPTSNLSSVISDLFGDEYIKKNKDRGGSYTGNPYSGEAGGSFRSPFGPTTANDVARWSSLEGSLRDNSGALSTVGGLFLGPLGGVLGKYSSGLANYFGERSYDNFLAEQDRQAANVAATQGFLGGQVGTYADKDGNIGTISNQKTIDDFDRETFGITGAEMDAARESGGGGWTDAGGGSFNYSADTGYDR